MKRLIIFLLFFCTYAEAPAQLIKTLGFGSWLRDDFQKITPTSDGGFIATGSGSSGLRHPNGKFGKRDVWVFKPEEGKIAWSKFYGGIEEEFVYGVAPTADGAFVCGKSASSEGPFGLQVRSAGDENGFVGKIDVSGALLWADDFGYRGSNDIATRIQPMSDGGCLVAYTIDSAKTHMQIVRYDGNGKKIWKSEKVYHDLQVTWMNPELDGSIAFCAYPLAYSDTADACFGRFSPTGELEVLRLVGRTTGTELPVAIFPDTNGSYIICGLSNSNDGSFSGNKGGYDVWFGYLSTTGELLWNKFFGGSKDDIVEDIIRQRDGSFVLCARSGSSDGAVLKNNGNLDAWVVKINPFWNIEWQHTFGGSGAEINTSLAVRPSGEVYVVGSTNSPNGGDIQGRLYLSSADMWMLKLSATGERIDAKVYGGDDVDFGGGVMFDALGEPIVIGHSISGDLGPQEPADVDLIVAKYTAAYDLEWMKFYGGTGKELGQDVIQRPDGGYAVLGYASSLNGDLTNLYDSTVTLPHEGDIWVLQLDASGAIQSQRVYGEAQQEVPSSFLAIDDGGYLIWGSRTIKSGNADGWLLATNADGSIRWQFTHGGVFSELPGHLIRSHNGEYVLAGGTLGYQHTVGGEVEIMIVNTSAQSIVHRHFGGSKNEHIAGRIIALNKGGYALLTISSSNDDPVFMNHGGNDLWLVELDDTMGIVRSKTFGGSRNENAVAGLYETEDGGLIFCAASESLDGDPVRNRGEYDIWVVELDVNWNIKQQNTFGADAAENAFTFSRLADGVYAFGGVTLSTAFPGLSAHGGGDAVIGIFSSTFEDVRVRPLEGRGQPARLVTGGLIIELPEEYIGAAIFIYDAAGRQLSSLDRHVVGITSRIEIAQLVTGVYMAKIMREGEPPIIQRFCIVR